MKCDSAGASHHPHASTLQFFHKLEQKFDDKTADLGVGSAPAPAAAVPGLDSAPSPRQLYQYRRQYGVNLGSWFVLEKWLTPSVFQGAKEPAGCELDIAAGLGAEKAKAQLEAHWDGFVNDGDWKVSTR